MTKKPVTKEKHDQNERFRLVCFTVFDMDFNFEKLREKVQYYAYGKEVCPKTGKDHYQAFAYVSVAQRWSWWQKALKPNHFEKCNGNLHQNEVYCSKSNDYTEWGLKPMGDGVKRGMLVIKDSIEAGVPLKKIQRRDDHFEDCIRYRRALKEFEQDVRIERMYEKGFVKKTVSIYVGATGTHKSRDVRSQFPDVYSMPDLSMQWAGSYDGQSAVIFDDVGPGNIMSVTNFLRITDGYPIEVAVKGGYVAWSPEFIFFTSNVHYSKWWPVISAEHLEAVKRRLASVRVYKSVGVYEEKCLE